MWCKFIPKIHLDNFGDAVLEAVNENKKIRTTARKYKIDKMTLLRYINKYNN